MRSVLVTVKCIGQHYNTSVLRRPTLLPRIQRNFCNRGKEVSSLSSLSIKDLKTKIEEAGMSHKDCFEKSDLINRATAAQVKIAMERQTFNEKEKQRQVDNSNKVNDFDYLDSMTIPELKLKIEEAGLSHENCFEMSDLVKKAKEAHVKLASSANDIDQLVIQSTARWLDEMIIGLGICPFASAYRKGTKIISISEFRELENPDMEQIIVTYVRKIMKALNTHFISNSDLNALIIVISDQIFADIPTFEALNAEVAALVNAGGKDFMGDTVLRTFHPSNYGSEVESSPVRFIARSPWPTFLFLRQADKDASIQAFIKQTVPLADRKALSKSKKARTKKCQDEIRRANELKCNELGSMKLQSMLEGFSAHYAVKKKTMDFHRMFNGYINTTLDKDFIKVIEEITFYGDPADLVWRFMQNNMAFSDIPILTRLLADIVTRMIKEFGNNDEK